MSFMVLLHTKYYTGDYVKKNEMGSSCGTCGGHDMCVLSFGRETWGKGNMWINKPTRRRKDNIKINFEGIGCDCLDCIYLLYFM
jgi:hypothetical protein